MYTLEGVVDRTIWASSGRIRNGPRLYLRLGVSAGLDRDDACEPVAEQPLLVAEEAEDCKLVAAAHILDTPAGVSASTADAGNYLSQGVVETRMRVRPLRTVHRSS